jgi:type IV secretory pathway VirB6-like protein
LCLKNELPSLAANWLSVHIRYVLWAYILMCFCSFTSSNT